MPSPWGCPRPACASWVGPGRLQNPRRPSRSPPPPFAPQAVPLLLPPRILQTVRPPAGAGGTPLRGTPGSEPSAEPASARAGKGAGEEPSKRPQNLSRAAAAATAGRRGKRGGRRDELVERRGKKVLRLFRCYCEPETRGPCCPAKRQDLGTPDHPAHRRGRLLATRRSSDAPIPDQPSGAASPASREDFTPKLGAPLARRPPPPPACLLSPPHPRTLSPPGADLRPAGSSSPI